MAQQIEAAMACSFCGRPEAQVEKLVSGPGVYICNTCIELCQKILDGEVAGFD